MKYVFAIAMLCVSSVMAHAQPSTCYDPNPVVHIFQVLTGSQPQCPKMVNPKTTHTHTGVRLHHKNGHRNASTIHKSHAFAGATKSPVHTNPSLTESHDKLFQEFLIWKKNQEWQQLLRGSP